MVELHARAMSVVWLAVGLASAESPSGLQVGDYTLKTRQSGRREYFECQPLLSNRDTFFRLWVRTFGAEESRDPGVGLGVHGASGANFSLIDSISLVSDGIEARDAKLHLCGLRARENVAVLLCWEKDDGRIWFSASLGAAALHLDCSAAATGRARPLQRVQFKIYPGVLEVSDGKRVRTSNQVHLPGNSFTLDAQCHWLFLEDAVHDVAVDPEGQGPCAVSWSPDSVEMATGTVSHYGTGLTLRPRHGDRPVHFRVWLFPGRANRLAYEDFIRRQSELPLVPKAPSLGVSGRMGSLQARLKEIDGAVVAMKPRPQALWDKAQEWKKRLTPWESARGSWPAADVLALESPPGLDFFEQVATLDAMEGDLETFLWEVRYATLIGLPSAWPPE
ncbi:MAG: hypothetical protein HYU36_17125 [Planctomycetes bacterium]|nr:hypothetical protein [Planctomycetota bacterium]